MTRRDSLVSSLVGNPKAKFVTRGVQFGSEPLFDNVLPHSELASQVISLKSKLSGVGIPVTVSELAYGYQERGGAQDVLDAIDFINAHMLPFFSALATTGSAAWPLVEIDLNWFIAHGNGKKIYLDEVCLKWSYRLTLSLMRPTSQNGWPSVTSPGVQPNSVLAQPSVANEAVSQLEIYTATTRNLVMASTTRLVKRNSPSSLVHAVSRHYVYTPIALVIQCKQCFHS
jgi:hypothetical protein